MAGRRNLLLVTLLIIPLLAQARARAARDSTTQNPGVKIALTKLEVTDKTLEIRYEIGNDSADDIWLCDDVDARRSGIEVYIDEDAGTLKIRRRLDVPLKYINRNQAIGRYARLPAHERRSESLLFHLPVRWHPVFTVGTFYPDGLVAKRLSLEIGFYKGNLPMMVLDTIKGVSETVPISYPTYPQSIADWFGGVRFFIRSNEPLRDRDERVRMPWSDQNFKGEQSLQIARDDVRIPCRTDPPGVEVVSPPPQLSTCTRVEIRYQPSMLQYFFPYASQQALLDAGEKDFLQAQKTLAADDPGRLRLFSNEIATGFPCEMVKEGSTAHVVCYRDDKQLASFTVYSNMGVETEEKQRYRYSDGLQSLRLLTPQIEPFELRMRCADNLRDLWYRMRWYHAVAKSSSKDSSGTNEITYPGAAEWCASTAAACQWGYRDDSLTEPYRCPSTGEGKCHYAMNPNGKTDSPGDVILLFETKAGWNQHGGPELFSFTNHDPRGGCALLNDGTVKFIRTKAELKQLRWK